MTNLAETDDSDMKTAIEAAKFLADGSIKVAEVAAKTRGTVVAHYVSGGRFHRPPHFHTTARLRPLFLFCQGNHTCYNPYPPGIVSLRGKTGVFLRYSWVHPC